MLVPISQLLGRMTGIQKNTGLEKTEHSPLSNPLFYDSVLLTAADQEQEQIAEDWIRYEASFRKENAL